MTKNDYVAKITSATPVGLVIITIELILEHIAQAESYLAKNDIPSFEVNINKSKEFLMLLMKSLDFNVESNLPQMLYNTYKHINALLISAYIKRTAETLPEARDLLNTMLADWNELKKTENDTPVIENAQKLYAGLTYKNGELSEYEDTDTTRGYKA